MRLTPFSPLRNADVSKISNVNRNGDDDLSGQSTWLVVPYFVIYTAMYLINTLVTPLLLLERSCIHQLPDTEGRFCRGVNYSFEVCTEFGVLRDFWDFGFLGGFYLFWGGGDF